MERCNCAIEGQLRRCATKWRSTKLQDMPTGATWCRARRACCTGSWLASTTHSTAIDHACFGEAKGQDAWRQCPVCVLNEQVVVIARRVQKCILVCEEIGSRVEHGAMETFHTVGSSARDLVVEDSRIKTGSSSNGHCDGGFPGR